LVCKSIFFDWRISFTCTYSVMCDMGTERTSRSAYGMVKRPRHGNYGVDRALGLKAYPRLCSRVVNFLSWEHEPVITSSMHVESW
jgi:hypothetical protein